MGLLPSRPFSCTTLQSSCRTKGRSVQRSRQALAHRTSTRHFERHGQRHFPDTSCRALSTDSVCAPRPNARERRSPATVRASRPSVLQALLDALGRQVMQVKPYVVPKTVMQAILVWLSRLALQSLLHRSMDRKFRIAQICFGRGTCARFRLCICLVRSSCWSMHFSALHVHVCGSYWEKQKEKEEFSRV